MGAVGGGGQRTAAAALLPRRRRRPARGVTGRRLGKPKHSRGVCGHRDCCRAAAQVRVHVRYHAGAGAPQVVVQQLGGPVLEGLGQGPQQHGELRRVQLKQGDQHHLGRLHTRTHRQEHTQWSRWCQICERPAADGEPERRLASLSVGVNMQQTNHQLRLGEKQEEEEFVLQLRLKKNKTPAGRESSGWCCCYRHTHQTLTQLRSSHSLMGGTGTEQDRIMHTHRCSS